MWRLWTLLVLLLMAGALAAAALEDAGGCLDEILPFANFTGPLPCQGDCEDLEGKVALITGGSTGIGHATAERLAAAGMTVVGTSRHPEKYTPPGTFELWQLDQTSPESVAALISRMNETYGRIDFLHLNAGRWFLGDQANSDMAAMQLAMDTNYFGTLRVLRAALPLLPTDGYARIVMTLSVSAFFSEGFEQPYVASKRALEAVQEEWELEHGQTDGGSNVQLTALFPGPVATNLINNTILGCPELAPGLAAVGSTQAANDVTLAAPEVGEAVYRIAIDPSPAKRYFMAAPGYAASARDNICRRMQAPMEDWWAKGSVGEALLQPTLQFLSQFRCPPRPL